MTFELITCDKCGPTVRATFLVKMISGELAFCGHHLHEYSEALDKLSYEIIQLNKEEPSLDNQTEKAVKNG